MQTVSKPNQDTLYLIMWKSRKSGGTYSELRKTDRGRDRFLTTLIFLGVDKNEIIVVPQNKVWAPIRKGRRKKNGSTV